MFKSRIAFLAAALCTAALLPVFAKADTLTYNFTYSGTGEFTTGETATGLGSITLSFASLGSGGLADVTAFSFTDTLTTPNPGSVSSTFTYGLGDIASSTEVFGGTLLNPTLSNITLQTNHLAGTNSAFGNVDFVLNYSGVTFDSTGATTSTYLPDFTSGGGTITLVQTAAAPEPSSLILLGTGLAGASLLFGVRRRSATNPLL